MIDPQVFFSLESPPLTALGTGIPLEFVGIAFDEDGRDSRTVVLAAEDLVIGECIANWPSDELGRHLPHLPAAARCRFRLSARLPESTHRLQFATIGSNGAVEKLAEYAVDGSSRGRSRIDLLTDRSRALLSPPPDIVELTQGHRDAASYQASIVPSLLSVESYLEESGAPLRDLRTVLDFGCGSGRLLASLWLDDESRKLRGCDINPALVEWAAGHLPPTLRFQANGMAPPLSYENGEFDLIIATSVYTHLGRARQERWAAEIRRVLRPAGILLVTMHGDPYVRLFQRDRRHEFETGGYLEQAVGGDGGNSYASFHSPGAAEALFRGFELQSFFPAGKIRGLARVHPLAAFQDVYVFRKSDDRSASK